MQRDPAQYPAAALNEGVRSGYVKARLTLTSFGRVDKVEILEAAPREGLFEHEAMHVLMRSTYTRGEPYREIEERLDFAAD